MGIANPMPRKPPALLGRRLGTDAVPLQQLLQLGCDPRAEVNPVRHVLDRRRERRPHLARDLAVQLGDAVREFADELDPDSVDAALIRVTRRDWDRFRRVPPELAGEMRHASGIAVAAWDEAKAASDFSLFAPHLERQLELKRRYVECFSPAESPYDILLEDYEEGMTTAEVAAVFAQLKPALQSLADEWREVDIDLAGDDALSSELSQGAPP